MSALSELEPKLEELYGHLNAEDRRRVAAELEQWAGALRVTAAMMDAAATRDGWSRRLPAGRASCN